MPSFALPVFNLSCGIWTNTNHVPSVPPRVVVLGNLATGRVARVSDWVPYRGASSLRPLSMQSCILFPKLTDVRDGACHGGPDLVECPQGSGRWYWVTYMEDVAKGFDNEHRMVLVQKMFFYDTFRPYLWPVPVP